MRKLIVVFVVSLVLMSCGETTSTPTVRPLATRIPTRAPERINTIPVDFSADNCPDGCKTHELGCDIKGNISVDGGEKIYHVPGQSYYSQTKISPEYGERWFCTEAEAKAAGWRKALN